jgi:diguanylate cyclase (GGDEF)-like protein
VADQPAHLDAGGAAARPSAGGLAGVRSLPQADAVAAAPPRAASSPLGRRVLLQVLSISVLLTLLTTAGQLWLEYRRELAAIEARVRQLETSVLPALAHSLWMVDQAQLTLQMEGLQRMPDMRGVRVSEAADAGVAPLELSVGTLGDADALRWQLPIVHRDEQGVRHLGELQLEASLDGVLARLQARGLTILGAQAISLFVLALLILLLVDRLINRRLRRLAQGLADYDPRDPAPAPTFHIPADPDELDHLEDAFDQLRRSLSSTVRELSGANQELARDVEARRRAEAEAARLAYHDPLTDLPNRRLLFERLNHELALSARTGQQGALLFIDLDHFKTINDARGHSLGDALLIAAAERIRSVLRDVDLLCRLGGDEFVAIVVGLGKQLGSVAQDARRVADKVRFELARPLEIEGAQFRLTGSVGVALFPSDGQDAETLLKHADSAMFLAKSSGRDAVRLFQPELHAAMQARHQLEQDLRTALAEDALSLAFQPLFDGRRKLVGAETLVRWQHPQRGWISPGEFIPVCEESGLIITLSDWVVRHAIRQLRDWETEGRWPREAYLAINLSPRQFAQVGFVDKMVDECRDAGVSPTRLVLEITEGVVLGDVEQTIERMNTLRSHGFRFYIDDFGSGYSSMGYLKRLPVDGLKIDQSFVRDLRTDASDAAIVEAILAIGHRFSMQVVAEGVETAEQWSFLLARQCDLFQGYYLGRPVDAVRFAREFLGGAAAG